MRTIRLAEASLANGPVRLICGGKIPDSLQVDPAIVIDALPPLEMSANHGLADPFGETDIKEIFRRRQVDAVRILNEFEPDALVIEMFPFGRKKFAGEIISIIEHAKKTNNPTIFSSVRDVLVTGRKDQAFYDQRAVDWLNTYFDVLLIHSDPRLIGLDKTFSAFRQITIPIHYTGYICGAAISRAPRARRIVVSAGGGRVGGNLVQTAIDCANEIKEKLNLDMLVITGPQGDKIQSSGVDGQGPKTVRFMNNLPQILADSSLSVSQCGYNTAVDVLQTRTPAIFVPFETATENEQLQRACLLTNQGRAVLLREQHLSQQSLLAAATRALNSDQQSIVGAPIDLHGARCSGELIRRSQHNA